MISLRKEMSEELQNLDCLPITRHGDNEIFWTTLMNEIGFLAHIGN